MCHQLFNARFKSSTENAATDSKEWQLGRTLGIKYARAKEFYPCEMPTPWQQLTSKRLFPSENIHFQEKTTNINPMCLCTLLIQNETLKSTFALANWSRARETATDPKWLPSHSTNPPSTTCYTLVMAKRGWTWHGGSGTASAGNSPSSRRWYGCLTCDGGPRGQMRGRCGLKKISQPNDTKRWKRTRGALTWGRRWQDTEEDSAWKREREENIVSSYPGAMF